MGKSATEMLVAKCHEDCANLAMDDKSTPRFFWIREHHIKRSHMVAKMEQKKADSNGRTEQDLKRLL